MEVTLGFSNKINLVNYNSYVFQPKISWHDPYSHATNDCNVFRHQVQSAIHDGRLKFDEEKMQLDDNPFATNMVNFEGKKVLIQPSQAELAKGKNVVVGDRRSKPSQAEASGSGSLHVKP